MTSQPKLSVQWTQHVKDPEEKNRLQKILKGHSTHLEVLNSILKTRLEVLEKESLAISNFDSPSWPYMQAHYVGSIREIKKVLELIAPMTEGKT